MKKDNDNAKEKHAKSNPKHQKAVALRTQWLKDNPDKKKERKHVYNVRAHWENVQIQKSCMVPR